MQGLTDVISLAAGGGHALALRTDGTLWAWGDNSYGQPYTLSAQPAQASQCRPVPVQVVELSLVGRLAQGPISLVLRKDGTLYGWGDSSVGQLGNGSRLYETIPVPSPLP